MDTLTAFELWLQEEGRVRGTIVSYIGDVRDYQTFLEHHAAEQPDQLLTRFFVMSFKDHLMNRGYAVTTINKKLNSLKVFNDFLIERGIVTTSFLSLKRDQIKVADGTGQVDVLTQQQVDQLLFYLETSPKVSKRNKLACYLFLYTGVRASELVSLKVSDVDPILRNITVYGKGSKLREINLKQELLDVLQDYCRTERNMSNYRDSDYLLLSQRGGKLARDSIREWMANVSKELGFPLYPHRLRHTFCTNLIQKGVDLATVSQLAGHSNVQMTIRYYINISQEQKQQAVDLL
ncbi:tyrosine-type recombinase/integrase [Salibacterium qingdaonense]|uniref:Integrase/recombinase XerD n=1 Tax=Salibacterium qingdaonense TaxID=266892 RepID=A0A1I4NYL5_9BACI|nr:tyrosine-type recombinase/integrase [Salibacterium qingdaonense]SFM20400.1 integrase/recombinase XerD [Salibacterium qingdaonense]